MFVTVPFPVVDLQFQDYALLSILLALLYLASTCELLAASITKSSLPLANELSLQKAASWSVAGIALTLLAGLVAGANHLPPVVAASQAAPYASPSASAAAVGSTPGGVPFLVLLEEYGGLLVPAYVLFKWWTFHVRGSRVVNLDLLATELNDTYRREILRQLGESPNMRATKDELFLACSKHLIASRLISGLGSSFAVSGLLVRMAPQDIANKLTFTYERMETLLAELQHEAKILVETNGLLALKGAPPAPRPTSPQSLGS